MITYKAKIIGVQSYISKKDGKPKKVLVVSYHKDGVDGLYAGTAIAETDYKVGDEVKVIENYSQYGIRINVLENV